MFSRRRLSLSSAAGGSLTRAGGEDGEDAHNGAAVPGPGQTARFNGDRTPLSAAAAIDLSRPRCRR